MTMRQWNLWDDLNDFDLGESGARPGIWRERQALHFGELMHTIPVLLKENVNLQSFRLQAEIAVPGPYGFIGIAFGARDTRNYEMVYISPGIGGGMGEIQYDPIMNGSSTWQIYNGPVYQAAAAFPPGEWVNLRLDVHLNGVDIYVGNVADPQLVIRNTQHGQTAGRIGVWGNLPGYIRNFSVEEIRPVQTDAKTADLQQLAKDSFVTEWTVSNPYAPGGTPAGWKKAFVEENGTLNINRHFPVEEKDNSVQTTYTFSLAEEKESILSFGFSDRIRLRINDEEVYQGEWIWAPPGSDGRIRPGQIALPVKWKAGVNTLCAELANRECMFGWGLCVRTGLTDL